MLGPEDLCVGDSAPHWRMLNSNQALATILLWHPLQPQILLAIGSRNLFLVQNCYGAHKTQNICSIACYGQSLPNSELTQYAFCTNGKSTASGGGESCVHDLPRSPKLGPGSKNAASMLAQTLLSP